MRVGIQNIFTTNMENEKTFENSLYQYEVRYEESNCDVKFELSPWSEQRWSVVNDVLH